MLRLWPETVNIYLFPGVSWLHCSSNRKARVPELSLPALPAAALLEQLKTILNAQNPPLKAGTRIALTVSDTLANIVAMPWQSSLQSSAEINAYAHACFQHAGVTMDDDWTMQAQFSHFEAMGLAYALPAAWLRELLVELHLRKLTLSSVLPLSAAIYFGVKIPRGAWPAVVLAKERFRHAAYVFGPSGMLAYDAEVIIGNAEESEKRLAGRITAQHGAWRRRSTWNAYPDTQTIEHPMLVGHQAWTTA